MISDWPVTKLSSKKSSLMMIENQFVKIKSYPGPELSSYDTKAITSIKYSLKIAIPWLGIKPRPYQYKTNALTNEPKSYLFEADVKD